MLDSTDQSTSIFSTRVCLDPETGEGCWNRDRHRHGQMNLADNLLIVQTMQGDVALFDLQPDGLLGLNRLASIESKSWNGSALAGDLLLLRSTRETVRYELAEAGKSCNEVLFLVRWAEGQINMGRNSANGR